MVNEVDSMEVLTMRQSYHELTQSLTNIKNTIEGCIHSFDDTIHITHSMLQAIKNAMKDVEHARAVIHQNAMFKPICVDTIK